MQLQINVKVTKLNQQIYNFLWDQKGEDNNKGNKKQIWIFSVNPPPPPRSSELVSDWLKFTRAWVETLRCLLFRISIMVWRELN